MTGSLARDASGFFYLFSHLNVPLAHARAIQNVHTTAHNCTQISYTLKISILQIVHKQKTLHTLCTHLHTLCTQLLILHTKSAFCTHFFIFAHNRL